MTSSQDESAPTATTAMPSSRPTSLRIRSANGVWYDRPNAGRSSFTTWPVDTSTASTPCSANARAMPTASSTSIPPSYQSVAETRTLIGRSPDCDIFLDDVTVSRKHAVLVHRDEAYYIEDQGSLNGTFLNRRRIESGRLENGDELQIGKYKLSFLAK